MAKLNAYDISQIYAEMELDLIKSMKRTYKLHLMEEAKENMEWEQWQKGKLRGIKSFRNRNKKIIKQYQKLIDGQIDGLLKDSYRKGLKNGDNFFNRLMDKFKNLFRKKTTRPPEQDFFKVNEDKVFNLIKSVKQDMHKANQAALRKMDDVYRQTVFKAQMYQQNGATTVTGAVDMATKDFLNKGINCITYSNGANVNIASYAEMCIRTANQRVTLMSEGIKRDEFGVHTVMTASHANTCPMCLPWQGRVLIDDVYSGGSSKEGNYPLLSEAMAEGFLHPNCRHHPTTFIPGVNTMPTQQTEEEKQQALDKYNAEQKQRYLERNIRKQKRIAEGSVDEENARTADARVRDYQKQLREHLAEHDYLRRIPWREKI